MSRDILQSLAERIASYVLVRSDTASTPVNLERIASFLDVRSIEKKPMAAEGYVEAAPEGGYRIALRSDRSVQRTRFSLAHEIGHVIIHKLSGARENSLSRQYREYAAVSKASDEEAFADAIAGALLIPPCEVSAFLPRRFSMRGIVSLAERCQASVPTALVRGIWYATQPCLAFHLRFNAGKPQSVKSMWAQSSRSFRPVRNERLLDVLSRDWITKLISERNTVFVDSRRDRVAGEFEYLELYRSRYFQRESVYGIAYPFADWKKHLFTGEGESEPQPALCVEFEDGAALADSPDASW